MPNYLISTIRSIANRYSQISKLKTVFSKTGNYECLERIDTLKCEIRDLCDTVNSEKRSLGIGGYMSF